MYIESNQPVYFNRYSHIKLIGVLPQEPTPSRKPGAAGQNLLPGFVFTSCCFPDG